MGPMPAFAASFCTIRVLVILSTYSQICLSFPKSSNKYMALKRSLGISVYQTRRVSLSVEAL